MQFNLYLSLSVLIILLIISFILFHLNQKNNIKIRKEVDVKKRKDILIKLYNIFIDASEKTNTKPFLVYGTLLGYVRNKDIICYDYDLDFGIDINQYNTYKSQLLHIIKSYPEFTVNIKEVFNYKNIEVIHKDTRISADIFPFSTNNDRLSRDIPLLYSKYYLNETCTDYPTNWIYPLKPVDFLNRKTFIPNIPSNLLTCYYGNNYIIPDHQCNTDCTICIKKID